MSFLSDVLPGTLVDGFHSATILTIASIAVALVAIWKRYEGKKLPLPPGPFNWPVVGSMFLIGSEPPLAFWRLAKRYGPLMYLRLGSRSTLVVSNVEMAKEIFTVHDADFASRPDMMLGEYLNFGKGLAFYPTTDKSKLWRKMLNTELLGAPRMKDFRYIREEEAAAMITSVSRSQESGIGLDLLRLVYEFSMNSMFRMIYGKRYMHPNGQVVEELKGYNEKVTVGYEAIVSKFNIADVIPSLRWLDLQGIEKQCKQLAEDLKQVMPPLLVERRKKRQEGTHNRECFLDVLLSLEGDRKLSDEEMLGLCSELIGAGTDTAAKSSQWTMAYLVRYPQMQAKAHEELDRVVGQARRVSETDIPNLPYIQAVTKEARRLRPVAPLGLPHNSLKEVVVAGYRVPANTQLFINMLAVMSDELHWDKPLEFRPERFLEQDISEFGKDFRFLPFGSGRRGCPGALLGSTSVTFSVATLLHAFQWSLPDGQPVEEMDFSQAFALSAHMKRPLIAVATPRPPASLYS